MAKNITLLGASYPAVPAVVLPQTGGGNATFVDPVELIDDNAGAGVTDKTWSADKLVEEFADTEMSAELTTAAPIQSFPDGAPYPMSLQFAIEPVQAGSGDPSPSNVRPITGWTGANVSVSPTQDAQDATVYPITFPSAAGTVYGATVTVNPDGTGKLTVNRGYDELTDVSQLSSFTTSADYGSYAYFDIGQNMVPNMNQVHFLSSKCAPISYNDRAAEPDKDRAYARSNGVQIVVRAASSAGITTMEGLFARFEDALFVYDLATPVTYSLTPGQVLSLFGETTNVWADTGDIKALSYVRKTVPEMIRQDTEGQIKSTLELTIAELWNI